MGGCRLSSSSSSSEEEKGYSGGEEKRQWLVLRRKFMCKNQGIKNFFLLLIKLFHQLFVVVPLKIVHLILKVNTSFPKWNFICNRLNTGKHFCSFTLCAQILMPFLWWRKAYISVTFTMNWVNGLAINRMWKLHLSQTQFNYLQNKCELQDIF